MFVETMKHFCKSKAMFCTKDENQTEITIEQKVSKAKLRGANFEDAISETGIGKFHYLLFLSIIPVSWATNIDTANISMILTPAECDLKLTLLHKGILNAGIYAGMVSSSLLWGFLADVFGRRNIIVYGYLADAICNILSGLSAQNTWILVGFKFLSGFIVSGAYPSMISYCAEFHGMNSRAKILLRVALAASFGNIINGVLALVVIPQDWNLEIYGFSQLLFKYNSWRIFLSLCGLPSLVGAICLSFFPESPKFLMSKGRNEEALDVFKRMFSVNTGKPKDEYPVESLEHELLNEPIGEVSVSLNEGKNSGCLRNGLRQMKPLFTKRYLYRLLLVIMGQFCVYLSANTIRLWQPHVFAVLEKSDHTSATFCQILDASVKVNRTDDGSTCIVMLGNTDVYKNNLIIAATSIIMIFIAGILVTYIEAQKLILFTIACPFCFLLAINWSTSTIMTLVLICLFVALMAVTANLVITITVNLFPTSLRTTAICLNLMLGRIGAITGSVLFPVLLQYGCFISISSLASFVLVCFVLIIFVPKSDEKVK